MVLLPKNSCFLYFNLLDLMMKLLNINLVPPYCQNYNIEKMGIPKKGFSNVSASQFVFERLNCLFQIGTLAKRYILGFMGFFGVLQMYFSRAVCTGEITFSDSTSCKFWFEI